MAIDPLKQVWLIGPASEAEGMPERLARVGLMHVADVVGGASAPQGAVAALSADTRALEAQIRRLSETLDVLAEYARAPGGLLSNLIPTPIETTRAELASALDALRVEALHAEVKDLAARRAAAQAARDDARRRFASLGPFRGLAIAFPAEQALRWTSSHLWLVAPKQARRIIERRLVPDGVTLEQVAVAGGMALVASVTLREDASEAFARLHELGLEPVPAPASSTTLDAYVAAIEAKGAEAEKELAAVEARLAELGKLRHQVELVLGHYEERLETARAASKMLTTGRAAVATGYVRERELDAFKAAVGRELPHVALVVEDPDPAAPVPVSLTNSRLFRPAQFLVEMFGLPNYRAFDPSAYLFVSFVVFYGFCFGDAIYGSVQLALSWALLRRYRAYPGLRNFFLLLAWGGVSSILMGALTGSWAANLWEGKYLGEGNPLGWLARKLMIGDPMEKPLVVLGLALVMGVLNQLWGVTMKFHGCWRQGDWKGALFDAGLWYLLLPGVIILVAAFFEPATPGWLVTLGKWLAIVGAVGLVLTQGRGEKSLAGKIVVGLVSLYGIVGSYGVLAFVGDTLSYSRLLALALTTTIVGMAVNIIGSIINQMLGAPFLVGVLVFALVAIPGHLLNLVLSGLGAFIHSARLIFVEFFGRFYEPGAERFAPLGASSGRIRVVD